MSRWLVSLRPSGRIVWLAAVVVVSVIASIFEVTAVFYPPWFHVNCQVAAVHQQDDTIWDFDISLWASWCEKNLTVQTGCASIDSVLELDSGQAPTWLKGARMMQAMGSIASVLASIVLALVFLAQKSLTRQMAVGIAGLEFGAGGFLAVGSLCLRGGDFVLISVLTSSRCPLPHLTSSVSRVLSITALILLAFGGFIAVIAAVATGLKDVPEEDGMVIVVKSHGSPFGKLTGGSRAMAKRKSIAWWKAQEESGRSGAK